MKATLGLSGAASTAKSGFPAIFFPYPRRATRFRGVVQVLPPETRPPPRKFKCNTLPRTPPGNTLIISKSGVRVCREVTKTTQRLRVVSLYLAFLAGRLLLVSRCGSKMHNDSRVTHAPETWLGGGGGSPSIGWNRRHATEHDLPVYLRHARLALACEAEGVVDHHCSALGRALEQAGPCGSNHLGNRGMACGECS